MKKALYSFIFFRLMKWQIKGQLGSESDKCILLVVPHTSWHDFYIGVLTRGIIGKSMNFVAKKELFVFPFGYFFRWMGGAPLNRSKAESKTEAIAQVFSEQKEFRLAIAPEGTRKKVSKWKTGFYYIALKANIPIVPVAFDWQNKEVRLGDPFWVSGVIEQDLPKIEAFFAGTLGKIPENSYQFRG